MFVAMDFEQKDLPRGFGNPVLAMELARSTDEVEAIIGEPGHSDRSQMRSQQHLDLVFIFAYGTLFVLMSILLWRRRFRLAKVLAVFSGFFAVMAAGLDIREDLLIINVISKPVAQVDEGLVRMIRYTAMAKWSLLYIAMILLAFVLIGRNDERAGQGHIGRFLFSLSFITGWLFLATAIIGLISMGSEFMLASAAPSYLEWSTRLLTLGLVGLAVTFLLECPSTFLRRL
jgi:hypothetical protein